ncbi:MAG: Nramp family divalent metal transporter [Planctomycetia bacterium]|nr:Nramp family divalent metal transporter [Planctomycetia bacterium]
MSDATSYDPYAMPADAIQDPPETLWKALRKIGPGIILAGSIVGSGELIATTTLGADLGFMFLWLILFSCVIKVFAQIELGRVAISSGKPTLGFLNELPGWRWRAHWQVWWWFFMLLATVAQMGAMVGSVGQALNLAFPGFGQWAKEVCGGESSTIGRVLIDHPEHPWAIVTALAAAALLLSGGYLMIERLTTFLVVSITFITVACVIALPAKYAISLPDLISGFNFSYPPDVDIKYRADAIGKAFAVFGMTGVGAAELYSYPYWCLEKGYARFVGPQSSDPAWARRANGWMRVMHLDAWVSMVVFTLATVSFYFLGATVLHREDMHPHGKDLMGQLANMYVKVFGEWTWGLFLIGGSAVLFKTLYVASAGHSRLSSDFFNMAKFVRCENAHARWRLVRFFCVFYPLLALSVYLVVGEPRGMVTFGGFAQGITLPVIAGATVYLRYRKTDPRVAPSRVSDFFLWVAFVLLTIFAAKALWDEGAKWLAALSG